MASMKNTTLALFLAFNILFFTLCTAKTDCPDPKPKPKPTPKPTPKTTPVPYYKPASCPRDVLKLGVCADLLGGLVSITIGSPPKKPCCSLIEGLADLEAAVCLCTAIKANVLGIIKLDVPLSISLLLNVCSKKVPKDFVCA